MADSTAAGAAAGMAAAGAAAGMAAAGAAAGMAADGAAVGVAAAGGAAGPVVRDGDGVARVGGPVGAVAGDGEAVAGIAAGAGIPAGRSLLRQCRSASRSLRTLPNHPTVVPVVGCGAASGRRADTTLVDGSSTFAIEGQSANGRGPRRKVSEDQTVRGPAMNYCSGYTLNTCSGKPLTANKSRFGARATLVRQTVAGISRHVSRDDA